MAVGADCHFLLPFEACQIREKACQTLSQNDSELAADRDHLLHCSLLGDGGAVEALTSVNEEFVAGFTSGVGKALFDSFVKPHVDLILELKRQHKELAPLVQNCYAEPQCRPLLPKIFTDEIKKSAVTKAENFWKVLSQIGDKKLQQACAQFFAQLPQIAFHLAEKEFKHWNCFSAHYRGQLAGVLITQLMLPNAGKGSGAAERLTQVEVHATEDVTNELVSAPPSEAKVKERRGDVSVDGQSAVSESAILDSRDPMRELFIKQEANLIVTTPEQNREFIRYARNSKPQADQLFVGTEAAELKKMNDLLQDKRFSDAIVNRYKRTLYKTLTKTKALEEEYPGLKIEAAYSDYKGLQILLKGKIPPEIGQKLNAIYLQANQEFVAYLREAHLLRAGDDTSTWFRMAYGKTFDEQALASRMSRKIQGPPHAASLADPQLLEFATTRLKNTQSLQKVLTTDKRFSALLEPSAQGPILQRKVFDLAKKAKTADRLLALLQNRYGIKNLGQAQAQQILDYMKSVDDFPAPLLIEKREIVNLEKAGQGGFTIDLLGVGSRNLQVTSQAVVKSQNIAEVAVNSRAAEVTATSAIQAQLKRVREIAGDIAKTSGDDSAGAFEKPWSLAQKQDLLNRLAADSVAKDIRMAFIPAGVTAAADRTIIATHGEKIEAFLRMNLEERGLIAPQRLDQFTFAVDMNATKVGQGTAEIMMATHGSAPTAEEMRRIKQALVEAVAENNRLLKGEGTVANYRAN